MLNRRMILGAGLTGLALVGTGGFWRVTRLPEKAYAPWQLSDVTPLQDIRLDAFRYAILAPNPHNRQPWLIRLAEEDVAEIGCDLDRRLPITDPFDRQTTIGFGTFIELARIAAADRGYAVSVDAFPTGAPKKQLNCDPVARLTFKRSSNILPDPLFPVIGARRSTKEPYDMMARVSPSKLRTTTADGGQYSNDERLLKNITAAIVSALEVEMLTPAPHQESVDLMRIGHRQIDARPDGIALGGPTIEAAIITGQISKDQLADPDSRAFQMGMEQMRDLYGSIPALIWITTPGNSRFDQLEAGRQYVRGNLRATQLGLSMHPMSQSLQEYSEVQPQFAKVHSLLGANAPQRVQMLARIGYGPKIGPSPRWPMETHITA